MASSSYLHNPMIHRDRRLGLADSEWVKSFSCEDMTVLIVCRGPIRQEALDVFGEMGMTDVGILLSEKDSIVYPRALAPELRRLDPARVHNVQDYTGASGEERTARIARHPEMPSTEAGNSFSPSAPCRSAQPYRFASCQVGRRCAFGACQARAWRSQAST